MAKKKTPVWSAKGLAKLLCETECKVKQVNIAQMTEIIGHLADLSFNPKTAVKLWLVLERLGERRAKRRAKK